MKKIIEYIDDNNQEEVLMPFPGLKMRKIIHEGSGCIAFYDKKQPFSQTAPLPEEEIKVLFNSFKQALNLCC